MPHNYDTVYGGLIVAVVILSALLQGKGDFLAKGSTPAFFRLQLKYIFVYFLAVFGDWLQGPYFYEVYKEYGYSNDQIEALFVVGFAASAAVGTFVGAYADRLGRKKLTCVYFCLYIFACVALHFRFMAALVAGRILSGIATSLLFSVFETWYVSSHKASGFDPNWIGVTFKITTFGNGLVAVLSGSLAQKLVDSSTLWSGSESPVLHMFGPLAPFELAIPVLALGCLATMWIWEENDATNAAKSAKAQDDTHWLQDFLAGLKQIIKCRRIFLLGVISSSFEGGMFCFVMVWTPIMQQLDSAVPLGQVFSMFMIGSMIGSLIFGFLAKHMRIELFSGAIFLVSAVSLAAAAFCDDINATLWAFICFEFCVGCYWPSVLTMKSRYIPERNGSTIRNIFRIPLNIIVCTLLLSRITPKATLGLCVVLMGIALLAQGLLFASVRNDAPQKSAQDVAKSTDPSTPDDPEVEPLL